MALATSLASLANSITYNGLGVDAIWISPIFPSPMADFGYDVSDYMRLLTRCLAP